MNQTLSQMDASEICNRVRLFVQDGFRLAAVQLARRWLIARGQPGDPDRAAALVQNAAENLPWTR